MANRKEAMTVEDLVRIKNMMILEVSIERNRITYISEVLCLSVRLSNRWGTHGLAEATTPLDYNISDIRVRRFCWDNT
jgi:hypothetical protein